MFEDWLPDAHERKPKTHAEVIFGLYLGKVPRKARSLTTRFVAVVSSVAMTLCLAAFQRLRCASGPPVLEAAAGALRGAAAPDELAFNASRLQGLDHLVMVAGHAILRAGALDGVDVRDSAWHLEGYQRDQDLPVALVGHIRRGVEAAAADPGALLVFSGGQTRPGAGPRDEGSGYYRVAEHFAWWGHARRSTTTAPSGVPVSERTVTEDYAADSFQNLLFSLCRFREVVGRYPTRVTVVSFEFKKRRFQDLHRKALRFPLLHFDFLGVQPPAVSRFDVARAEHGEFEHSVRYFEADPYGCRTPALAAKRSARNPFRRTTPYTLACPDIRSLFNWCGPGPFPDRLPWEADQLHALRST
mmetsp:Transcript_952/g.2861  ORF Transcript_952/g.2861 Transcript_952/m.2861 type:complete len:358 (-) Transcript_952:238-1311(-)